MMLPDLRHASRTYEFVRHMPVSKLVRRLELDVRRRMRDRLPQLHRRTGSTLPVTLASAPPLPLFPARSRGLSRDADGYAFTFLDRTVRMGPAVDWHAPGPGAHLQLWRMHLHYMEYLETVDDADLQSLVDAWISGNPVHRPGAWRDAWNSYALSLRVVVWMQQLALRRSRLDAGFLERAHASLAAQIAFLAHNLETDLGGNHLLKNLKALIWAGAYFEDAWASAWRHAAVKRLAGEIETQILPDGVHYERSPSYHAQVLADLIECRQALGRDPLRGRLDLGIRRMQAACLALAHPDGRPALFNDAGLSMAFAPAICAEAGATVLGTPAARQIEGGFAFPDAGYFGLRLGQTYFIADCGRIAPDDLPAHGHGDILSFEWSVAGRRIIVDPGVFEYVDGARRSRARSAHSHNTLALAGCDQADFFGSFRCGRRPQVRVHACEVGDDALVLEGSHDGYGHVAGAPRHVRRFDVDRHGLRVTDRVQGAPSTSGRLGFLLHPDVGVERADGAILLHAGPVAIRCSADLAVEIVPAVWWPDLGVETPTRRLLVHLSADQLSGPIRTYFEVVGGDAA